MGNGVLPKCLHFLLQFCIYITASFNHSPFPLQSLKRELVPYLIPSSTSVTMQLCPQKGFVKRLVAGFRCQLVELTLSDGTDCEPLRPPSCGDQEDDRVPRLPIQTFVRPPSSSVSLNDTGSINFGTVPSVPCRDLKRKTTTNQINVCPPLPPKPAKENGVYIPRPPPRPTSSHPRSKDASSTTQQTRIFHSVKDDLGESLEDDVFC